MTPDTTDLTWVAEHVPDVSGPDDAATGRARSALMEHVEAAAPAVGSAPAGRAARGSGVARRSRRGRRRRDGTLGMRLPRRPVTLGLVAGAAAAAVFAIVNVSSHGHGGSLGEAQAAQIVRHARHALDVAPGQTLSYTVTDADGVATQTAEDHASPQDWSLRPTAKDGTPGLAEGSESGMREFYDRASNTIYRNSDTSQDVALSPSDVALLDEMSAPGRDKQVDVGTTLDGRKTTEITSTGNDGNTYRLWVDGDDNDRPLQFEWTLPSGEVQTTTWSDYQSMTPSAGAPSAALLTDDYPSAAVTTVGPAEYRALRAKARGGS